MLISLAEEEASAVKQKNDGLRWASLEMLMPEQTV